MGRNMLGIIGRMNRLAGFAVVGLAFALAGALPAQILNTAPPEAAAAAAAATAVRANSDAQPNFVDPAVGDNYELGNDDLLSVFVEQVPEYTRQVRVNADGNIQLPYLTRPLPARGLTTNQIAQLIAGELRTEALVRDPRVQVAVRQVVSRPVVIAGAVHYPVTLQATHPMTLMEALTRAGGVLPDQASGEILVSKNVDGQEVLLRQVNLSSLLANVAGPSGALLEGGEEVRVEPARQVYVVGDFVKPGAFHVTSGEPITVLRAVGLAQGFGAWPDKGRAELIHQDQGGKVASQPIDLKAILKHPERDVEMQPGDILYVPENGRQSTLVAGLKGAASTASIAVGYGLSTVIFK